MAENKIKTSCRVLVIGGSAGSLEVLLKIFPKLSNDLKFPVVVVLHRKNSSESALSDLFKFKTLLPVKEIEDKQILAAAQIYFAPADYHVLFENDRLLSLDYSEKVNYSRPSIDVTFESAAEMVGEGVACLLLSGANSDGSKGLAAVKENGGYVLIQDPDTAESPFMPLQAMAFVKADAILNPDNMAEFINAL